MRYCIVNGDDFGASHGIVRGILEANERGILTSTSLMVDMPASAAAAAAARSCVRLGVGLHFDIGSPPAGGPLAFARGELRRQLERFFALMDAPPTHLDAHHNTQRRDDLLPCFQEIAARHDLPLREHSLVRYFPSFYGRWNGQTHLEQISVDSLLRMLEHELGDGITELSCHPGYFEPTFASDYGIEREVELHTLCDPALRAGLEGLGVRLIDYRDLPTLARAAS